jgi:alpha-L-fucosidase
MEELSQGQKISAYLIEVLMNGTWEKLAEGESIGHRRLHRTGRITAEAIRIRCTGKLAEEPVIRRFAVYR